MNDPTNRAGWTRHFVYRSEHSRTTWKFRLALLTLGICLVWLTSEWWTISLAGTLVCQPNRARSDAVLVENFDQNYRAFERAALWRRAGDAKRVLVPIPINASTSEIDAVALGVAQVMARMSGLDQFDIVPIRVIEPISLNAARDVLDFIKGHDIRSVVVISPLFRSRRSELIYETTFALSGITVGCEPVRGTQGVKTWIRSWHGVQNVVEEWFKLQYYRLYVLPFRFHTQSSR